MDEQTIAELRALRARAYGPDADIADDPDSLRRLQQLEAAAQPPSPEPEHAAPLVSETAPEVSDANESPVPDPELVEDAPAEAAASESPRAPRWTTRRVTALWVSSLVVAIIVASTVSWAVTRRVQADPLQVAVLGIVPGAPIPGFMGDSADVESTVHASFYGFSPVAITGGGWMQANANDACLYVVPTSAVESESDSISGPAYFGCGASPFPASVEFAVTAEAPAELREVFPIGSALQFVLQGDEVLVLAVPATARPSAS